MTSSSPGIVPLMDRLAVLEAESAIRRLLNRYMALCDVPGPAQRAEGLAQLFCEDAVWQGVGSRYAKKFGRVDGRAAIVSMLMSYLPPQPHFQFNAHFLNGERLCVDGTKAEGQWWLQQLSRYDSGHGESIVAALGLVFRQVEGVWLIESLTTERLDACPLADPAQARA